MNEHFQDKGVRKYAGNDLIELQSEPLKAIQLFFSEYDACVLKGVEAVKVGDLYNISAGLVCVGGLDHEGNHVTKLAEFKGVEAVSLPIFLSLECAVVSREYADGRVKPISYNYTAVSSAIEPATTNYLEITQTGAKRFLDVTGVTRKLDFDGNGKDVTVAFSEAPERVNITPGEKLSGIMGKLSKWFVSFHKIAFTGKAKDIIQDITHRFVSDTEKAKWNDTYRKTETFSRTEITEKDTACLRAAKTYTDTQNGVNLQTAKEYANTQDATNLQTAKDFVIQKINDLIAASPGALDTLNELAAALGNDPNFATTITNLIATKAPIVHNHTTDQITDLSTFVDSKIDEIKIGANILPNSKPDSLQGWLNFGNVAADVVLQYGGVGILHSNLNTGVATAILSPIFTAKASDEYTLSFRARNDTAQAAVILISINDWIGHIAGVVVPTPNGDWENFEILISPSGLGLATFTRLSFAIQGEGASVNFSIGNIMLYQGNTTIVYSREGQDFFDYTDAKLQNYYPKTETYSQGEVNQKILDLISAAPGALSTLNELAAALGDNPNFATTITTLLAGKAPSSHNHDNDYQPKADNVLRLYSKYIISATGAEIHLAGATMDRVIREDIGSYKIEHGLGHVNYDIRVVSRGYGCVGIDNQSSDLFRIGTTDGTSLKDCEFEFSIYLY